MLKYDSYLVLGIGTDIGKTYFVEKICKKLPKIMAIKPISSGFEDFDEGSDTNLLLKAQNLAISLENIQNTSPWRFSKATSPHIAAQNVQKPISFGKLVDFCQNSIKNAQKQQKTLLIEAAGGVMTPINDDKTFVDLALELKIPVLLLSANYLGAISHTLCAIATLEKYGIMVDKVIINDNLKPPTKRMANMAKTVKNLSRTDVVLLDSFLNKND